MVNVILSLCMVECTYYVQVNTSSGSKENVPLRCNCCCLDLDCTAFSSSPLFTNLKPRVLLFLPHRWKSYLHSEENIHPNLTAAKFNLVQCVCLTMSASVFTCFIASRPQTNIVYDPYPAAVGPHCTQSYYGCCPDGYTSATGPGNEGCYQNDCVRTR